MKTRRVRTVPDWTVNVLWFVAGIGATGAVWYFLSIHRYSAAVIAGVLAFVVAAGAVWAHATNARVKQRDLSFHRMKAYACLMMKSHEHEYFEDESLDRDTSEDPWVIYGQATTELMIMLGRLPADHARTLLVDWLAPKAWEERLEIARTIVRRTARLKLDADAARDAAVEMLRRLADIDLDVRPTDAKGQGARGSSGLLASLTMQLLKALVVAGSSSRRDEVLKEWASKQRVVRRDL